MWDDVAAIATYLSSVENNDVDDECRGIARSILSNEILQRLLNSEPEDMKASGVPA